MAYCFIPFRHTETLLDSLKKEESENIKKVLKYRILTATTPLNKVGLNALHILASNQVNSANQNKVEMHQNCLASLQDYGLDINSMDYFGRNALHFAASAGNLVCLSALLNTDGCQVNAQSIGGETALMKAIQHGNVPVVQLLLQHGASANPNYVTSTGLNTLHFATQSNNYDIQSFIAQVLEYEQASQQLEGMEKPMSQ
ncbi:hypothetical protein FGO68_gene9257 [Halteria grandinella]|uniref:Ankyrin repeat domain-containing protein n=1 Tax=Halteria grandinella TaxID=5974 RepID=A0A8J8SVS2_HALGN|nr:hypothetical protein FGO68_gene9257 [Halteria grandinella]